MCFPHVQFAARERCRPLSDYAGAPRAYTCTFAMHVRCPGMWRDCIDPQSKNEAVDAAWAILDAKGIGKDGAAGAGYTDSNAGKGSGGGKAVELAAPFNVFGSCR